MKTIIENELDVKLYEQFSYGSEKFANNPLHERLKGDESISEKLSFIPRMLFFVLGFKDLMEIAKFDNPKNEKEKSVNIHSEEDSYHWKWYLKDLTTINEQFRNAKPESLMTTVWDNDTLEVRKTIYLFMQHLQSNNDPTARMLIIEVLEMTFDKFKEAIHPTLKEANLYDQLDYFGLKHQETEENHTTGISDDEIAELINELPNELKEEMTTTIEALMNQMYKMAANWAA